MNLQFLPHLRDCFSPARADRDQWPEKARLIAAAYDGDVRRLKGNPYLVSPTFFLCLRHSVCIAFLHHGTRSPLFPFFVLPGIGELGRISSASNLAKSMDKEGKGIQVILTNTNLAGMYPLHTACNAGCLPVLRYLVEDLNMDVNKPDTMRDCTGHALMLLGYTPAEHAAGNGRLPALRFLLDHGADLHHMREGVTLLHAAVEKGQSEIARFLLSRGARVDVESSFFTPVQIASHRGYAGILKMLLEHNADPNKHFTQLTPLDMALNASSVPCVKLLLQAGADVSVTRFLHPLARAAKRGLTEAVKSLVEAGANANVPDKYGRLPIELAAEYGTWEDVEILFPDDSIIKKKKSDFKRQAADAFRKENYLNAAALYTQALKVDHFDATLFSNRSICWLRLGEGEKALDDASKCKKLRANWAKAYYRKGAALMLLKGGDGPEVVTPCKKRT
ncbi:hypothetical protein PR202_gb24418 [Eleusine coracana subsp. coracana]|uniref:Ankyrin-like protein n=1 Tax=Eleusine coracana subsp. coracana TaxID=191504 RepID=A0AAV5FIY3_ELECO|nr:hypothetical protein PR202_gb24418 [Eleusine coracana subsp. coracana]